MPRRPVALFLLVVTVTACNHGHWEGEGQLPNRDAVFAALAAGEPDSAFAKLEDGLLGLYPLRIGFHITAEGAYSADLRGHLDLSAGSDTLIAARGTFGGEPADLLLLAAGDSLMGGNGSDRFLTVQSPFLNVSLLVGLTRMGLLHNLARLVAGQPPDHADGGVRTWVVPVELAVLPPEEGTEGLRFGIRVSGMRSGEVTLVLDPETGLPSLREQTVAFPSGTMTVTERYSY